MTGCDLLRLLTSAPKAFWRFDIDISLDAAARMARFAQVAGVRGTFYVMATSEFYNPFSGPGANAISAIHQAGHRLGAHVDYRNGSVERLVHRDRAMLEAFFPGVFSDAVSFHMPPKAVLWRDYEAFDSAYAARWEGRYVSDSRREWNAEKETRVTNESQVALHAEHWFPFA